MLNNLRNKTAIVTGASHGIGMEIGRKLLIAGANVVFSDYNKFELERQNLENEIKRLTRILESRIN